MNIGKLLIGTTKTKTEDELRSEYNDLKSYAGQKNGPRTEALR